MKKSLFIILLSMLSVISTMAEGIGTWTLYPSYTNITEIRPTGKCVYVLASGSLYSYNVTDGSIETYSKNDILSDNNISHIAWVPAVRRLVITYDNSNIDLLDEKGNVTCVSELYQKTMTESKTINHILVSGKYAYMSAEFGITKLNVANGEFMDTYRIGKNVEYSYIEDGYLYAAVRKEGMFRCKLTDNMLDPNLWKLSGPFYANTEDLLDAEDTKNHCNWTAITKKNTNGTFLTSYITNVEGEKVYSTEGVRPDGPDTNECYHLEQNNGKILIAPGAYNIMLEGHRQGNVFVLENNKWTTFQNDIAELTGLRYQDINYTATDPLNSNHVFAASKNGLFEFLDGKFVKDYRYGDEGVPFTCALLSSSNPKNWGSILALAYDKSGNLWLCNHLSSDIICYTKNREWKVFDHKNELQEPFNTFYSSCMFDSQGRFWFTSLNSDSRIFCYDPTTDKLKRYDNYTNQDGITYTPAIYDIAEDKEHNIWFTTNAGPFYFSAEDIATNNNVMTQHKVPRNDGTNYADYLLSGLDVNCITIDAANRKWMGTMNNGIYLISSDNNTQEYHFTTENSPLPSNNITDIKIDPLTGRVYIATGGGLCSFMGDITENNLDMNEDNVHAYPNPVSPEYTGPITIVGLEPGSDVKILSTSGYLVAEGKVTGGSFQWNGCNNNGERVATGVYMVNVAREDGSSGIVTKIAVVR